jgi:hypothetical protein
MSRMPTRCGSDPLSPPRKSMRGSADTPMAMVSPLSTSDACASVPYAKQSPMNAMRCGLVGTPGLVWLGLCCDYVAHAVRWIYLWAVCGSCVSNLNSVRRCHGLHPAAVAAVLLVPTWLWSCLISVLLDDTSARYSGISCDGTLIVAAFVPTTIVAGGSL